MRDSARIMTAVEAIKSMARRTNVPTETVEAAVVLFKKFHKKHAHKRYDDVNSYVCLYIACRQQGVPLTLKDISAKSAIAKKKIGRCLKKCLKELDINLDVIPADDFTSRFSSILNLPNPIQCAATHIAKKAVEMDVIGNRMPISIAAAAIYMASQASEHKKSKKEIAKISGVAQRTITNGYKQLIPYARNLFPENFIFITPLPED